jgi:hypothetical protein
MRNPLTQKVNSVISLCFIACFGVLMTIKILDFAHAEDPIIDAVAATQVALEN